ncbi:hypothetical protein [Levilactobacillus enshiensis]|uniref:hypothetical protein n=1 Tax=Levilactobacillus enshiensis TaxID=2590213 RepID=UPI00117A763A|nr:hypothetical protein [Levilactobacillus enshiensis]
MKLRRRGMLLLLVLSLVLGLGMAATTSNQTAYAKARYTMKTFPKSIRGTWYSYQYHKMYRIKITAKKMTGTDFTSRLHSRKVTAYPKSGAKMKHPSWVTARMMTVDHEHWVNVMGWYQTAGDGESYRQVNHKIGGQRHRILQTASGAGFWTDSHGYQSKHLAKKYANHYFKGERINN